MTVLQRTPTRQQYEAAAARIGCRPQMVIALSVVEGSERGAFYDDGFPTILYERHVFHRVTGGRFDLSDPELSAQTGYGPGGYGSYAKQRERFARASQLDAEGAIQACSWGLFQLLGENWRMVGAASPGALYAGMCSGVGYHLECLAAFVLARAGLREAMRDEDLVTVALLYNGRDEARFHYHEHLRQALDAVDRRTAQ